MIHFNCEHCGQEFSVFDKVGGKFGRCKVCGGKMKIPEANSANTRETYEAEAVVHVEDGQGHAIGGEELAPGGVDRFMEEARQIIYLYGGTTPECLMRLTSLAERYGMDSKEMNVAVVALAKNPDTQTPPKNQEAVAEKTSKDKATGGKPKRLKAFGEAVEAHVRGNMMTEVMVEELVLIGTLRHGLSEQQVRAEIDKAFELSGAKVIDEAAAIAYMNGVVDELMEGELYVSDKLRQRFYKLGNEVGLAQFLIDEIVLDRFNPVRLSKKVYREIALISGLVVAGVLLMVLIFSGTWGGDSDKASNARVPISDPFKTHGRPVVHREALNEEQWPTEMIRFDIQAYAQLIGGVGAWSTSLLEDDVTGRGAVGYPGMWAAVEKELADAKKTERLARLTLLVAHVYISEPDEILVTRLRDQLISKLAEAVEGDGASNRKSVV